MSDAAALPAPGVAGRFAKPLFAATIVTGSFLLFLVQPMVARMALPRLGGAPAVWNSAMVVFQALLLAGYAYAHLVTQVRPRVQAGIHLGLFALSAIWLPIGLLEETLPAGVSPAVWAPWFLFASIGPLFFIVSAQAPLMQRWYALDASRGEPWALYAASNLGSFAGLLSYPLVVEPLLTLRQQSMLWTVGYAVLVLLVGLCALTIPAYSVEVRHRPTTPAPPLRRIALWMGLAAIPSGLMLSTTTHLTTDIVAVPMLWVVPLGLYLLSFVIAFADRRRAADGITGVAPIVLLIGGGFAFSEGAAQPLFNATVGLAVLLVTAIALHTALYRLRPAPERLTAFYLAMAGGGMVGGIFCAILAPLLYDWAYEHPVLMLAAALLIPQRPLFPALRALPQPVAWGLLVLAFGLSWLGDMKMLAWVDKSWAAIFSVSIALLALLYIGRRLQFALAFLALMLSYGGWQKLEQSREGVRTRSYFGIYTVNTRNFPPARILTHGTTLHGVQSLLPGEGLLPTSYYARGSGVGHALASAPVLYGPNARIGVVGLGAGTLTCYAMPGEDWRVFEIDPAMVEIARTRFTFLKSCAPQARIILGDARLSLSRLAPHSLDILAVDAFSSDAVPMHLLTQEAIGVYRRVLAPNGLLLVHISNRYLNLAPVLAAAARTGGWAAAGFSYEPSIEEVAHNLSVSIWVAMSPDAAALERLKLASGPDRIAWKPLKPWPGFEGWTDDHASILPILEGWQSWVPR
jgi:SAM-dependent methyltransferase